MSRDRTVGFALLITMFVVIGFCGYQLWKLEDINLKPPPLPRPPTKVVVPPAVAPEAIQELQGEILELQNRVNALEAKAKKLVPATGCGCHPSCGCKKGSCKCHPGQLCAKGCDCLPAPCGSCQTGGCYCGDKCECVMNGQCCPECTCVPSTGATKKGK